MITPPLETDIVPTFKSLPGRLLLAAAPTYECLPYLRDTLKIAAVVSLTTSGEMASLGIGDLPAKLADLGMFWVHCPIVNLGAKAELPNIDQCVSGIIERLRRGENVLVHCYHGMGRTGAVAACCLMKASGLEPKQAIREVKKCRKGTFATKNQCKFVSKYWGFC